MTAQELLRTAIVAESDVFAVRQRGRELAAAVGLEGQDCIRVATAISEVGRQMLAFVGLTDVVFTVRDGVPAHLTVQCSAHGRPTDGEALLRELEPARRLMDRWSAEMAPDRVVVVMGKPVPAAAGAFTTARLDEIRATVAQVSTSTPLQELAVQNRNLLATLEEIQCQRDELLRLNAELAETNRGVMALYTQLSDELEATNRGVVALYAELDEKSAQLRDANEAKSRFLANVSHELRAPATAIIGLLRLLLDPRSDRVSPEQRHQLDLVRASAEDLLSLVNELLDLAKAESGRIDPQWTEVDLRALFGTLRGTLQPLVAKPGLVLTVVEPTDLPSLVSDPILLGQILRNLLTNAIKFTERGEVLLHASHEPGSATLDVIVSDTGPGIPPAERERVFEEFYQIRSTAHAAVKGTGLGLPYARRLAGLLGGSLTLSSVVGQGSRFVVTLPLRAPAAVVARGVAAAGESAGSGELGPTRPPPGGR